MSTSQENDNAVSELHPLVAEAQRRGYLSIDGELITYRCKRRYKFNWNNPEERVRAVTYSWLAIERSYSPQRIRLEVTVRGRGRVRADIVVYKGADGCRRPWLVVENKREQATYGERLQGIEQGFDYAHWLRAPYMLFDCGRVSMLFDVQRFDHMEREANRLGSREAIPEEYGQPSRLLVVTNGPSDILFYSAAGRVRPPKI
jgi:type I restriction enzyme M protein